MSLPCFWLRHGRRNGDADPVAEAVAGSDPPSRHASIGIGENRNVHRHPPLHRGSLPASSPMREGQENESQSGLVAVMRGAAEQPPASGSTASKRRSTPFRDGWMLRERPQA